jgi:hypothetical protein
VLALELRARYPKKWELERLKGLLADRATCDDIVKGRPLAEILSRWDAELAEFQKVRAQYLLY